MHAYIVCYVLHLCTVCIVLYVLVVCLVYMYIFCDDWWFVQLHACMYVMYVCMYVCMHVSQSFLAPDSACDGSHQDYYYYNCCGPFVCISAFIVSPVLGGQRSVHRLMYVCALCMYMYVYVCICMYMYVYVCMHIFMY